MPEQIVDTDGVRAGVAGAGRLIAEAAAREHKKRLVLVGVAVRRRRALARVDLDQGDAEPLGSRGSAESAARRGYLTVIPALLRNVVDVNRRTIGHVYG